jgi:U5 small nuclear ribonucleoprotein component
MKILIMGENYTKDETEDSYINEVKILQIHQTRYKINVNKVPLGNFVLIDGSDISLSKNLTIVEYDKKYLNQIAIFKPLLFEYSYMKVSVEPLNPLDLPKMVDGLRKINQSYPASKTKVEESGENIILGTGELYFDSILNDLRNIYSDIEIKVSDPMVTFKETILETSSFKCTSSSYNNKNKIGIIAEPMNKEVVHDLKYEQIQGLNLTQGKTREENLDIFKDYLIKEKNWDKLTTKSIWAFNQGSNILIDYTLPMENDTQSLYSIKNEIIQGFDWTCKEGPLVNEPIVNTKFKILSSEINKDPVYKGSSQIIPMVRRACYSSFVTACPRLMEPILIGEVHCTFECIHVMEELLVRRRGHINSQIPMPGAPFYIVRYVLPALDSFGLETDIRTTTAGMAFGLTWFNGFQTMQGDPLDKNIHYFPLEPSTNLVLAREVLIKTRRRKGLNEDINILNYLNEEGLNNIKEDDEYKNYI